MNKNIIKRLSIVLLSVLSLLAIVFTVTFIAENTVAASADEVTEQSESVAEVEETASGETEAETTSSKSGVALAAGIAIAISAGAGAIGMGMTVSKSNESMARQPEIKNDIRSSMMLGLVFIETAIIYALVVTILLIFVL